MERPVVIPHRAQGLYGVLHEPPGFERLGERVGLLLVHSQGGSKVGHKRSFVELGRYLEGRGVATFRFDLFGEGESEELLEDPFLNWRGMRPAIDFFVGSLSLTRLAVLGDCFGGMLATHYAALEPRVERVMVFNLAQMRWSDEQLDGYEGAGAGVAAAAAPYWRRLFLGETWVKLLRRRIQFREVARRALLTPLRAYAARASRAARRRPDGPKVGGGLVRGGRARIPVHVFHASSAPGSAEATSIARHVFGKLGVAAEHIPVAGIPFSGAWKATVFSEIEERLQRGGGDRRSEHHRQRV